MSHTILVPRGRATLGSAPKIATSGQVQHWKSMIHGLPVTLRMFSVKSDKSDWLLDISIYCVYETIQNQNVVGPGQRSRLLVLTKRLLYEIKLHFWVDMYSSCKKCSHTVKPTNCSQWCRICVPNYFSLFLSTQYWVLIWRVKQGVLKFNHELVYSFIY